MFNIAKKAKEAGFNAKQTEFLEGTVNTIEDTHVSNLSTKNDLLLVEERLNNKISLEISDVKKDLKIFVLANSITIITVVLGALGFIFCKSVNTTRFIWFYTVYQPINLGWWFLS